MHKDSRIYIAGHLGLVGSAIHRSLIEQGFSNFILRKHDELDLCDQSAVKLFFEQEQPEYVFLAAAVVGEFMLTILNQLSSCKVICRYKTIS